MLRVGKNSSSAFLGGVGFWQESQEITGIAGRRKENLLVKGGVGSLKALDQNAGPVFRVMRSYLHATGIALGLILNFGAPKLEVKRVFAQKQRPHQAQR